MVHLYIKSRDFVTDSLHYVPQFIWRIFTRQTIFSFLKFVGIFFVVLPRKNDEEAALYLWQLLPVSLQHVAALNQACFLTARSISLVYPVVIFLLLVSLFPLSIVVGLLVSARTKKNAVDEISDVNVVIARLVFGILIFCSLCRFMYECIRLLLRLLISINLFGNCLKLLNLVYIVSFWMLSKPVQGIWYILYALLSEPLEFVWLIISKVVYGTIGIFSIPLNYLYKFFSVILTAISMPFIWLASMMMNLIHAVRVLVMALIGHISMAAKFLLNLPGLFCRGLYANWFYLLVMSVLFLGVMFYFSKDKYAVNNLIRQRKYNSVEEDSSSSNSRPISSQSSPVSCASESLKSCDNSNSQSHMKQTKSLHHFETSVHSAEGR